MQAGYYCQFICKRFATMNNKYYIQGNNKNMTTDNMKYNTY